MSECIYPIMICIQKLEQNDFEQWKISIIWKNIRYVLYIYAKAHSIPNYDLNSQYISIVLRYLKSHRSASFLSFIEIISVLPY